MTDKPETERVDCTDCFALPGDAMDDLGVRYSLAIEGEPVVFEYTLHPDTREIRIPVLVWFH
ncbi:hypothetical protein ACIOWI_35195 [Streptomyces sp. NPDC087659]|uniref:hypothetical protein n=1 Tax=Streptomyces sp. NPDC087659 TaxID=3365801 RepID=UPI0037F824BB